MHFSTAKVPAGQQVGAGCVKYERILRVRVFHHDCFPHIGIFRFLRTPEPKSIN